MSKKVYFNVHLDAYPDGSGANNLSVIPAQSGAGNDAVWQTYTTNSGVTPSLTLGKSPGLAGNTAPNLSRTYKFNIGIEIGDVIITNPTSDCQAAVLPAKIEAEDYCEQFGVQAEETNDTGGGENIGYVTTGDWMDYQINVPTAGNYQVNYRVARNSASTGVIQLQLNGSNLSSINVPYTGSWQTWQTISNEVTLPQGTHTLRVFAQQAGWNLNWIEFISNTTSDCNNPQNLAIGKTVTQSSTYSNNNGKYGAANAIDGNNDGNHANGFMTHTNLEQNAWWEVDLGQTYDLSAIKIWNRTDCCANRLSNFHVLVSDTPFNSQALNATINQSGVNDYHFSGTAPRETDIDLNTTGRYLRIQLSGNNALQLAEVEIFDCTASSSSLTATLYKHCGYNGNNISLGVGEYPNIAGLDFLNNDLSSVKVPTGLQVILYQNINFAGFHITLTADNNCLIDNGFNDMASSVKITDISARLDLADRTPITILPNPTTGNLSVDISQYMGKSIRYMVASIQGKTLFEGEFESNHGSIENLDLSSFPNGAYILYLKPAISQPIALKFVKYN